jgi:DNA-binding XRE family transcriptional regulator
MTCGQRVADRRIELGLTRQDLAALVDTSGPTVHRIERGRLMPVDELRFAVAHALETEVSALWPPPSRNDIAEAAA